MPEERTADWFQRRLPDIDGLIGLLGDSPADVLLRAARDRAVADRTVQVDAPNTGDPAASALAEQATRVLEKLATASVDLSFSPEEEAVLDLVTLVVGRPSLFVKDGFPIAPPPHWSRLETERELIARNVRSIGAITLDGQVYGSGVLLAPDLVLTNNHVVCVLLRLLSATWFKDPAGYAAALQSPGWTGGEVPRFELGRELGGAAARTAAIRGVKAHALGSEMAILRIDPMEGERAVPLGRFKTEPPAGRRIYVVGFPVSTTDARGRLVAPAFLLEKVFASAARRDLATEELPWTLETRRLAPGELAGDPAGKIPSGALEFFSRATTHDAATLGGNSGSAVFDLETHLAIGLHFGGMYTWRVNAAVPFWRAEERAFLESAGVQFEEFRP